MDSEKTKTSDHDRRLDEIVTAYLKAVKPANGLSRTTGSSVIPTRPTS